MASSGDAIEREVRAIQEIGALAAQESRRETVREKRAINRHFGRLMELLGGRIYHFTRIYGLMDMPDDARQACAIGVHRAIAAYDPAKARFTTFVTWQLRGELQSLRHRVRLDQRDSAKRVGARTVSMDQQTDEGSGDIYTIVDEAAVLRTEAGASRILASRCADALLDEWEYAMRERDGGKSGAALTAKLGSERQIVRKFLFETPQAEHPSPLTKEQERQVTRRVLRHCAGSVGIANGMPLPRD